MAIPGDTAVAVEALQRLQVEKRSPGPCLGQRRLEGPAFLLESLLSSTHSPPATMGLRLLCLSGVSQVDMMLGNPDGTEQDG